MKRYIIILLLLTLATPAQAATGFEVSAWIPWWKKASGTPEVIQHITSFTEISPFGYTVNSDGTLVDTMKIDEEPWPALVASAKINKVRVIPSITWSDPSAMDRIFRSPTLRKAHIKQIVDLVTSKNYDGIDIDYENKDDKTKIYFSYFLRDLYKSVGKKFVTCSVEPRTPLDSRFDTIPTDITYSNDFTQINKYCDRVRIMVYDQGRNDLKLNRVASTTPYAPIADSQWVEKVVRLALKEIPKKKLILGIPTYGHAYNLAPNGFGGYNYDLLRSFNAQYALDIAASLQISPIRQRSGELGLVYLPSSATSSVEFAVSSTTSSVPPIRFLTWSDASAIRDKINLAKRLGLKGVAIFKIDGGEDQGLWQLLGE